LRFYRDWLSDLQPFTLSLLRFVVGICALEHGTAKLFGFPPVEHYLAGHLPPLILAAGLIEVIGGALVAIGLLTRPAAFLMSGEMAVAYFKAHAIKSFFPLLNGGEAAVLYCFILLYLAVAGGGPISLDRRWAAARQSKAGAALARRARA
jgi:putative oxidoreductase